MRQSDAMQRRVHLAITATVEPMTRGVAGSDGDRSCPVPCRERCPGAKPGSSSDLAHDFGCRQRAATGKSNQRRSKPLNNSFDFSFELVDTQGELAATQYQFAGDTGDGSVQSGQTCGEAG